MTCTRGNEAWTDEQIAELRRLVAQGMGGGEIAKAMARMRPGLTRNGVIGAMDRRGIESLTGMGSAAVRLNKLNKLRGVKPLAAKRAAKPGVVKATPSRPMPLLPKILAPRPPQPASTWAPLPGTRPRPLLEHKAGQCRWPVTGDGGAMLFCCAPQAGDAPYCSRHRRMAYVPGKRRAA